MLLEHALPARPLTTAALVDRRLILYHKHSFSGRTLFLHLSNTICQFEGISSASEVIERHIGGNQVTEDLSELVINAEQRLDLASGSLTIDREFQVAIEDADKTLQIYLARFTMIDAPQEQFAEQDGKFIALTEARRLLPATELELLGLAYSTIMDELV